MSFLVWFCKGWLAFLTAVEFVGAGFELKDGNYMGTLTELIVAVVNLVLAIIL